MFRAAAEDLATREAIIRHSTSSRLPDAWYRRLVRSSTETATREAFAAYFESWARDDFADECHRVRVPVLAIVGAQDQAITPQVVTATWLQSLAAARMEVMTDVGHYPMQEAPLLLAKLVTDFLGQVQRVAAR